MQIKDRYMCFSVFKVWNVKPACNRHEKHKVKCRRGFWHQCCQQLRPMRRPHQTFPQGLFQPSPQSNCASSPSFSVCIPKIIYCLIFLFELQVESHRTVYFSTHSVCRIRFVRSKHWSIRYRITHSFSLQFEYTTVSLLWYLQAIVSRV